MTVILAFVQLTIRETSRRRVLLVLGLLSLISVGLVAWGVERLVTLAREDGTNELLIRIGVSQILVLIAFMFSFVLAMTAAFLGAPAIAGEIESGVALAVLARPIRRWQLLVGRWLGLSLVVAAYTASSGLFAVGVVAAISGVTPRDTGMAIGFLTFEAVVMLTLAMALSTRLPGVAGGAIAVVVFGLGWIAGVLASVGSALGVDALRQIGETARILIPTDGLWRGVVYGLEPPAAVLLAAGRNLDALEGNPFFELTPPPAGFVAWAVAWVVIVLALGALAFRRREV
jgi:ABC-type transport system involved in multi-copper enzyme maturation permease subunit